MLDHSTTIRSSSLPAGQAQAHPARGFLRWVYTSNPFYILSADLVFFGLRMSLDTSGKSFETWALMLALAGYTLLLATTACILVRLGNVWDDIRTILLLVVLMFLAISVTFDPTLTSNPALGRFCFLGGFLFAILVSEGLLRGLRLALPWVFRLPYYLILALFFVYPVALIPLLGNPDRPALQWALFGFSPVAGVVFLSLLPAIRRGHEAVRQHGAPWRYPWYPWVLFGLLGAGVCGRAFYLCISLHFVERSNTIFGLYFLVPFLFAVAILLLEAGLAGRNRFAVRTALLLPLATCLLAITDHRSDPVYRGFLALFIDGLGSSPLYLTLIATAFFYLFAMIRQVPLASDALTASLLALSFVGPGTTTLDGLVAPQTLPLFLIAYQYGWLGLLRRNSRKTAIAALSAIAATTIWLDRSTFVVPSGLVVFHLTLIAALLIGVLFDDAFARFLRQLGAIAIGLACLVAMACDPALLTGISPEGLRAYPMILGLIAAGYGALVGGRSFFAAAAVGLGGWLVVAGWRGYFQLRQVLAGLDQIALGLVSFVLAALISLKKAGALERLAARRPGKDYRSSL
jgi:hypothetical protein